MGSRVLISDTQRRTVLRACVLVSGELLGLVVGHWSVQHLLSYQSGRKLKD